MSPSTSSECTALRERRSTSDIYREQRPHCAHLLPRLTISAFFPRESTHTNFLQAYCLPFSIYPTPSPRTVLTLVKLIQAALCITSCLNSSADFAIDGLLCRDTMQGLLVWEETVVRDGVVHDWPSGEVVAGLLSSIWAARSKLADMGIDKVRHPAILAALSLCLILPPLGYRSQKTRLWPSESFKTRFRLFRWVLMSFTLGLHR